MELGISTDVIELAIPIFFGLLAFELVYSVSKKKDLYRYSDTFCNIGCGIIQQLTGFFFKLALAGLYIWVFKNFSIEALFGIDLFPSHPIWAFLYSSLVVDFFYYWFHRTAHEVNILWASHVVHHQSEEYNLAVALRQSSFQTAFNFVFFLPVAFLAVPVEWMLFAYGINLIYQFWIHTELVRKMPKWFEAIFNTPSHHRVHHGQNPEYIDRNHAGILIIWDRFFGTFEPEKAAPVYGVVEPLKSWNPLWANIDYYYTLAKTSFQARRWEDKIWIWFARPGWKPQELGGFQGAKPVQPGTFQKFIVNTPRSIKLYVTVQFFATLAATLVCLRLANSGTGDLQTIAILTGSILYSMAALGGLLNVNPIGVKAEWVRLIVMIAVSFIFAMKIPLLLLVALFFGFSSFSFGKILRGVLHHFGQKSPV